MGMPVLAEMVPTAVQEQMEQRQQFLQPHRMVATAAQAAQAVPEGLEVLVLSAVQMA